MARQRARAVAGALAMLSGFEVACSSSTPGPTQGSYTIDFPTTEAAVATDYVQVLVFAVDPAKRDSQCGDLENTRATAPGSLAPALSPPAPNICELHAGVKALTLPYGEHVLLAIAERRDQDKLDDILIGCVIATIGDGTPPAAIPLHLLKPDQQLPASNCKTVGDYCANTCG